MKMVKSLLLGAAAGMVAVAGAQAADLPVKAKPVQYVKICSLYGAGFYYMPGTDTCLKVGGFVRAEANVNSNGSFAQYSNINFDNRDADREVTRARAAITADARSQTEYGTLRAYFNLALQADSGTGGDGGSGVGTWSNRMFIQWAGFTAGLADSYFDFDTFSSYSNQTNVLGSSVSGAGILLFAYTAQFGNGLSATLSAEDTQSRQTNILGAGTGEDGYAGRRWPDIVANLRLDQAWGSAQIMGAVHNVNAGYYAPTVGGNPPAGEAHPSDEIGYAIGAGLKFNLPMLGKRDFAIAQVTYAKGAMDYVGEGLNAYSIRTGPTGNVMTALGPLYDSTFTSVGGGSSQDLTDGWSVSAAYQHGWNAHWKTSLYGAYGDINYSDTSSARISANEGVAPGGSADWSIWQVGSRTVWTPVKNLDLSVDVMYNHVDTAFDGQTNIAGTTTFESKGWWAGMFRAQRNFYP
jgi:hypothetical protein